MEQKRLLLAIGLSFLVFFVWSIAFSPKGPVKPTEQEQTQTLKPGESDKPGNAGSAAAPQEAVKAPAQTVGAAESAPNRDAREIVVETPLYRMTLSENGGAVISMILKDYRETVEAGSPNKELIPKETRGGTALVSFGPDHALESAFFKTENETGKIDVQGQPGELLFSHRTAQGVRIEKHYRFLPDSYLVDLTVSISNESGEAVQGRARREDSRTRCAGAG